ncbi:MAG: carboxypeptidase-like regulatory domain-containing protein, partial [Gemmatimonadetes bacterium]|nr:carboxypeptidase-like regulatory domain-containing protein [Gemmatimonadota bacterium]
MFFLSSFIPILACVALLSNVVQAQSVGTITGTVTDAASGEKLEAVQVHIPTLKLGVVSDEQGRFTIPNVPSGTHELRADLISYASATAVITVTAGETVTVALQMNHSALYLDEVVVTGSAFEESPISLTYA